MQSKIFYTACILVALVSGSCDEVASPDKSLSTKTSSVPLTFHQKLINRIDSLLPIALDKSKYLVVYRMGSIEYSADYSVLCIPLSRLNDSVINCNYYMFNNIGQLHLDNPDLDADEPKILGFSFTLKNGNRFNSGANDLDKYSIAGLNRYITRRVKAGSGEGHCDNYYLISYNNADSVLVLDASNKQEKEYFKSLYKQISPSEYYQVLSLDNPCERNGWDFYQDLSSDKNRDSFVLNHGDLGKYW